MLRLGPNRVMDNQKRLNENKTNCQKRKMFMSCFGRVKNSGEER